MAWFASDLRCEGKPFEAGSRNILKRALAEAAEKRLGMNLGMEAEFFVFEDTEASASDLRRGSDGKQLQAAGEAGRHVGLHLGADLLLLRDNNRTNTLRIPLEGKRVELRAAGRFLNPYLGGAMVLAASLEGIARARSRRTAY